MLDFRKLWDDALSFEAFVAACKAEHCGLWQGIYKLARIPDWALAAVPPGAGRKLLVIAEDWCGDASNTVPIIARLVDLAPGLELRVIRRDENPELMDQYLTNGSRSIPIVIALDEGSRRSATGVRAPPSFKPGSWPTGPRCPRPSSIPRCASGTRAIMGRRRSGKCWRRQGSRWRKWREGGEAGKRGGGKEQKRGQNSI